MDIVYECAVNKSHPQKKFVIDQQTVPQCCGKLMALLQAPQAQPAAKAKLATQAAATPRYSPTGRPGDNKN